MPIWLKVQSGQSSIIRFSRYTNKYDKRLRWQNGFQHQASVCFLCMQILIELRPYVSLDELLVSWCFHLHDVPEGLLGRDVLAPNKTEKDDLDEYSAFREHFSTLDKTVWVAMHRAYLLQTALKVPRIFPKDARKIANDLRRHKYFEALAFQGIQVMDYLYYAEECATRNVVEVLEDVASSALPQLDQIAKKLPGFTKTVWTPERRAYFERYIQRVPTSRRRL